MKLKRKLKRKKSLRRSSNKHEKSYSEKDKHAKALLRSGINLSSQGRYKEAITNFQKSISLNPQYIDAYIHLGVIYDKKDLLENAISCFKKVISLDSQNPVAHYNLGVIHRKKGLYEVSIDHFKKTMSIDPQYPYINYNLGLVYALMNNYEEAIVCFHEQLSINPEFLLPHHHLAVIYEKRNVIDKAKHHLEKGLKCNDSRSDCLLLDAKLLYRNNDFQGAIERLELIGPSDYSGEIYNLYGKIYDRIGEESKAFNFFTKSNNYCLDNDHIDNIASVSYLNKIAECNIKFSKDWLATWTEVSPLNDSINSPVFLVGFPRSGTTLLDQILTTDTNIEVLEEWPILELLIEKNPVLKSSYPDSLAQLNKVEIEDLRREYFQLASPYLSKNIDGKIIIDKFPLNITRIGLISRIFPEAKIILALRHPFDVCLSCFMQSFKLNAAMANFLTLETTVKFYSAVMDLWRQYEDVLAINYISIKYENIVDNFELETRKLFKFLSIPWSEDTLNYYQQVGKRKSTKTPSYQDISKPIFTRSKYRWKRYEKYFESVKDLLIPHVEYLGYDL